MKNLVLTQNIKSFQEQWIKQHEAKILEPKILKFSKIIKVNPKKIIFKNLKNIWGNATKDKSKL